MALWTGPVTIGLCSVIEAEIGCMFERLQDMGGLRRIGVPALHGAVSGTGRQRSVCGECVLTGEAGSRGVSRSAMPSLWARRASKSGR